MSDDTLIRMETLPKKLKYAVRKIFKKWSMQWYNANVKNDKLLDSYLRQVQRSGMFGMMQTGFYAYSELDLHTALNKKRKVWNHLRNFIIDGMKSLMFHYRMTQPTSSEIAILIMVIQNNVFTGELSQKTGADFGNVRVPHVDNVNTWKTMLWDWVKFCSTYTDSVISCAEMKHLFTTCLSSILPIVSTLELENKTRWNVWKKAKTLEDVKFTSEEEGKLFIGMVDPDTLTQLKPHEQHSVSIISRFMSGDFSDLEGLFLQVQITLRAIQFLSPETKKSVTFSNIKEGCANITLHPESRLSINAFDYRNQLFRYPVSFNFIPREYYFVECKVSIAAVYTDEDDKTVRRSEDYAISLALPIWQKILGVSNATKLLNAIYTADTDGRQRKFLTIKPGERMVVYRNKSFPKSWTKYSDIRDLIDE